MTLPRLLLLTDRTQLPPHRSLIETVGRCVDAGLTTVVLRELDLPETERRQLARDFLRLGVTVISARTTLPGTWGVHLASSQESDDVSVGIRRGRSCHDEKDVQQAANDGAAYVTASPVAMTASKPGYGPALGGDGLRRMVESAGAMPVFALGGVSESNAASMRAHGAYGVAVMGGIMRASDPAAVVRAVNRQVA
jgi:thiamine-phosphate pyrophosphorylase